MGVVSEISGSVCGDCVGVVDYDGVVGEEKAEKQYVMPDLGAVQIDIEMRKAGDEGIPVIVRKPGQANPTWDAVDKVMENLIAEVEKRDE